MKNTLFDHKDFDIFSVQGLEPRMKKIKSDIQPKFQQIGYEIEPFLSMMLAHPVTTHIAKHARRTVNPPDETWVAWSTNKRGYKSYPHFQFGLNESHVFVWFALIYECNKKSLFANSLKQHFDSVWATIPSTYFLSQDHTKPEVTPIRELVKNQMASILTRLETIKRSEFLCGTIIPRENAINLNYNKWMEHIRTTYQTLYPLYELATNV